MKSLNKNPNINIDLLGKSKIRTSKFQFNDHLQISKCKNTFSKDCIPDCTKERFIIKKD